MKVMSYFMKFGLYSIAVGGFFLAIPLAALAVWWLWAHFVQSPNFAANYFDGVVKIESVLESRRWHWGSHPWAGNSFGCSYAIATLPADASPRPPKNWGQNWDETPVQVSDGNHDILGDCTYLWSESLIESLTNAHGKPGSYYISGSETLLLYSPGEKIAARIRFGD